MKNTLSKIQFWGILISITFVMTSFNNCSDVRFEVDEQGVENLLSDNVSLLINNGDTYTNKQDVLLTINSDNATEMMLTNNTDFQTSWEPYKKFKDWQLGQSNKEATVYVRFRTRGVESKEWTKATIIHDNIAPNVNIVQQPNQYTRNTNEKITYSIQDSGSGVLVHYCSKDDDANTFYNCTNNELNRKTISVTKTIDGTYTNSLFAVDRAGNTSEPETAKWTLDREPPTIKFLGELPQLTPNRTTNIDFIAEDKTSGVAVYLCNFNNSTFQVCQPPYQAISFNDGTVNLQVKSVDYAGNTSTTIRHQWEIHTSAPLLRFLQPLPDTLTMQTSATIKFTGSDNGFTITQFSCSLNNQGYRNCTSPDTLTGLTDGTQTIRVRGKDRYGNYSAPISYSWVVDTKINNIRFDKKPAVLTNSTDALFQIGGLDADVEKLLCQFNSTQFVPCPTLKTFTFKNLQSKSHTLRVKAEDKIGNVSNTIAHTFVVDRIAPTIAIKGPANLSLAQAIDQFTITAQDNHSSTNAISLECNFDNTGYKTCSKDFSIKAAPDVDHSLIVKATDEAGNSTVSSPYVYKTITASIDLKFTQTVDQILKGQLAQFRFLANNDGYPIKSITCTLQSSTQLKNLPCANNTLLNISDLDMGDYTLTVTAVSGVTGPSSTASEASINHDFVVTEPGDCRGQQVCLVIADDFERNDLKDGDFGWKSFLIDAWSAKSLDISIKSIGQASSGNNSLYFTGRPGGSVHSLFIVSQEFDLSLYSSIDVEFDYIMSSFEGWAYGGSSGREHFRVEMCTLGELACGVKNGQTNNSSVLDRTKWKTIYEDIATSPVNQHLDGRNHTLSDYVTIRDNKKINIDLDDPQLNIDKRKIILRWSFKMDEGIIDEFGNKNYVDGTTPDAGILDNIIVKAYKQPNFIQAQQ